MWNNGKKYPKRAFNIENNLLLLVVLFSDKNARVVVRDIKSYDLVLNNLIGCWNPSLSSDWSTPPCPSQRGLGLGVDVGTRKSSEFVKKKFHTLYYWQTDSHGETSTPSQLRWRGYTNLFSMCRNRWKITPWMSKFHDGVTFSRPLVHILELKFNTCHLLTLKNDPGSHYSTGSLFNVTPAAS